MSLSVLVLFPSSPLSQEKMSSLLQLSCALDLLALDPWIPSLLMKSQKLSHSLLVIAIPAPWALLAHSSIMPRLLSSLKSLFDHFPDLVLSSPSQTFPKRSLHNRSPLPLLPITSHSILVSYPPSTKTTMISTVKDFLTNRPMDSLLSLYLPWPHPPHTPLLPSLQQCSVQNKVHHIISLSHSTLSSQIECIPFYLEEISAYALSNYTLIRL